MNSHFIIVRIASGRNKVAAARDSGEREPARVRFDVASKLVARRSAPLAPRLRLRGAGDARHPPLGADVRHACSQLEA